MNNVIQIARDDLLTAAEISDQDLEQILSEINGNGVDYADLFFASTYSESWQLEDSIIKSGNFDINRGVGIRVNQGEKSGFAYADDILLPALQRAVKAARRIAKDGGNKPVKVWNRPSIQSLYPPINPLASLSETQKIAVLQKVDTYIRAKDSRIIEVSISLAGEYEIVLIVDHQGELSADVRPLVRFNVSLILEHLGRRETGYSGGGGRFDYQYFLEGDRVLHYADEALRQALVNLEAVDAPAGPMTVVLGPGWPGVLLHEAVGHGLEGDFHRKGISIYSNRIGEKVASELCTVVDNGSLPNRRGSSNIDDEGTPTQNTVLIEKGILRGFMLDKRNARLLGTQSTGNGRRESYADLPIPRMTNTYMLAGESVPEDIIRSVKHGLYAVNFGGGQVDITSGKFVFSASEAYLIDNGKLGRPVKGATLIGNGPDVLTHISMIGNNLQLDAGVGICGKDGQHVPVGVGQPTVKVDELTVGGTRTKHDS